MNKFLFIFILLVSCVANDNKIENNYSSLNFNDDLSFDEFKIRLEEYAYNNPYPKIDN